MPADLVPQALRREAGIQSEKNLNIHLILDSRSRRNDYSHCDTASKGEGDNVSAWYS